MIHKTAIVSKKAKIAKDVKIGPYAVVEDRVAIGPGTEIGAGSYIYSGTTIGKNCRVFNNVILGGEPQDMGFKQGKSFVKIGDNNTFREFVTVHRGTEEGSSTLIGNDNYFMALSHIAHNCNIHNNVIICNNSLLAGYVEVEDKAFISGNCGLHQFVKMGTLALIAGGVRANKDIPPFMMIRANNVVSTYNVIGIKRANLSAEARKEIKEAYRMLFASRVNISNAITEIEAKFKSKEIKYLIHFIKSSKRGVCGGAKKPE